ncbi:MAG: DUF4340 domain-containing protein [Myxococcales bacterium]|nr:DUF4340 domain-containing protein [Myxococcales bacterium]
MNKLNKTLLALGVAQGILLLAVTLAHRGPSLDVRRLVPGASEASITALTVWGPPMQGMKDGRPTALPGATVALARRGDKWVMTSHDDHPVDLAKIEILIAALADAEASAPMTNDLTRHASLRVADNEYDRKLTIAMGGREQTLLIGLTTGQTAAIRLLGKAEVYESTRITPWSVASAPSGWMHKTYAQFAPISLQAIELTNSSGTWRFDRASGDWRLLLGGGLVVAPAGAVLDQELIRQLPNLAANLTAVGPADPNFAPPADAAKALLTVYAAGEASPQRFDIVEAGPKYYWLRAQGRADAVLVEREPLSNVVNLSIETVARRP